MVPSLVNALDAPDLGELPGYLWSCSEGLSYINSLVSRLRVLMPTWCNYVATYLAQTSGSKNLLRVCLEAATIDLRHASVRIFYVVQIQKMESYSSKSPFLPL